VELPSRVSFPKSQGCLGKIIKDRYYTAAVERVPEIKPEDVEELFMGNVLSAKYGNQFSCLQIYLLTVLALVKTLPANVLLQVAFPSPSHAAPLTRSARPA
jgi:hypothetical protein